VREAVTITNTFEEAHELVPEGPREKEVLDLLAQELKQRLPSTVVRIDEEIVAKDPKAVEPLRRAAEVALLDLRNSESWCVDAMPRCSANALAAARRVRDAEPTKCDGYMRVAELTAMSGNVGKAIDDVEAAVGRLDDRSACRRLLVDLAIRYNAHARADAVLDQMLRAQGATIQETVEDLTYAASVEVGRNNPRRAIGYYKLAFERAPERDDLLVSLAKLAEATGMHGEALDAYGKLAQRHPEAPEWVAATARVRAALQHEVRGVRPGAP
jgi:tetratricopeptide (TPR) repeat protein